MSPALAGGFLTTAPPGKPSASFLEMLSRESSCVDTLSVAIAEVGQVCVEAGQDGLAGLSATPRPSTARAGGWRLQCQGKTKPMGGVRCAHTVSWLLLTCLRFMFLGKF